MRFYPMTITLLVLSCTLQAQTNISGVVNQYYKVVEVLGSSSCVRVDNSAGLSTNDMVMIIQMKGATINTTNASFGSVTSMNNAGNYEINTVCTVHGDSVFLYKQLLQSYTVSMKVQLIRIPQYASAQVTDSLKATDWNSNTGKGGVLAISVSDNLILNAPVSANGSGYKGGAYATSSSDCSNFFAASNYGYDATILSPQNGAWKGESIADPAASLTGGKGAFASGGGGGNNHNNGGGGGGNIAAGGNGGGNTSASGCTTPNAGIGGYALSNNSGSRIFMGGGGGAGHANSGFFSTGGGNGGGIIFIHAGTVFSNGFTITANGRDGGSTLGDGASGGGAGGTIIFDVNTYADAINAQASGGRGGDEDDDFTSGKCYGEGGGGSGGAIFFKTTSPAGSVSAAGGMKGNKIHSLGCSTTIPAVNGNAGSIFTNYTYKQSSTISSCTNPLPLYLKYFDGKKTTNHILLTWELTETGDLSKFIIERKDITDWHQTGMVTVQPGVLLYQYTDTNPPSGLNWYRIRLNLSGGGMMYSNTLMMNGEENNYIRLFPNPASRGQVTILHTFRPGSHLFVYNDMGQLVLEQTIHSAGAYYKLDVSLLKKSTYRVMSDGRWASLVIE